MILLSPSKQMLRYFKIGHDRFISHSSQEEEEEEKETTKFKPT